MEVPHLQDGTPRRTDAGLALLAQVEFVGAALHTVGGSRCEFVKVSMANWHKKVAMRTGRDAVRYLISLATQKNAADDEPAIEATHEIGTPDT